MKIVPDSVSWQFVSGLNRVAESTAKEVILAQISESQCCDTCELKKKQISDKVHKLNHLHVSEMLIRRFVPSKNRE